MIMRPEPGLVIPLPSRMNRGINEVSLLIKIRELEKANRMTDLY